MKYNEDEKKYRRIIAKWFRENKTFVNRDEAIKELGVDDSTYDTLIRMMDYNCIVEEVHSVMGSSFWTGAAVRAVVEPRIGELEACYEASYPDRTPMKIPINIFQ